MVSADAVGLPNGNDDDDGLRQHSVDPFPDVARPGVRLVTACNLAFHERLGNVQIYALNNLEIDVSEL